MRVLLAEDEKRMAAALVALLKQEKYDVDHVEDGVSALTALESGVYDIAVLDVMMPEMNGFEVARDARHSGVKTPILMLTAKSQLDDKVEGLDSGADDYLTKPFQTKELLARIRALGRRSASFQDGSLRYGDLSLDPSTATLACASTGQSVRLSEKELRILEYMFSNQGQIMTREQLAVKIWGFDNEAEYNNVEVYMSFTRKKLAFVGSGVEIKAVRGLGYELREKDVKRSRRKIILAIMGSLILLFAITLSVITLASYREIRQENMAMLKRHVELYYLDSETGGPAVPPDAPPDMPDAPGLEPPGRPPLDQKPDYQLSTFYSVAFGENDTVITVDNGEKEVYSEEELVGIAKEILAENTVSGRFGALTYIVDRRPDYTLVALMDNTVSESGLSTLLHNVLIVGSAAILVMFFISLVLSGRIIRPLEENDRKQKQFISDASHELKTPVAVISTNAELLSREIGENEWLSNIVYENDRMGGLVRQLLDLSRAENAEIPMEQVDFSRLVTGEALALEMLAFDRGQVFQSGIEDGVILTGNKTQLTQLVSILLDNAIRHATGSEIEILLKRQGHHAVLSVSNDGDEIPQDKLAHLFDRFYRVDEARTGDGHHYGLGLSIAKAIAEKHGGSIGVSCQDGTVQFMVSIPMKK